MLISNFKCQISVIVTQLYDGTLKVQPKGTENDYRSTSVYIYIYFQIVLWLDNHFPIGMQSL